ncbi:hypothetical protein CGRA01v4_10398 [Colletotrichum graminicola]|nr:hypothetical protein CGRA01v4_10398 [Colletotrichum graminicola]
MLESAALNDIFPKSTRNTFSAATGHTCSHLRGLPGRSADRVEINVDVRSRSGLEGEGLSVHVSDGRTNERMVC